MLVYVLQKDADIVLTHGRLDNVIHFVYQIAKAVVYCDKSKIDYVERFVILEFEDGVLLRKLHVVPSTLDFIDESGNIYSIQSHALKQSRLELQVNLKKSSTHLFMPISLNSAVINNIDTHAETNYDSEDESMSVFIKDADKNTDKKSGNNQSYQQDEAACAERLKQLNELIAQEERKALLLQETVAIREENIRKRRLDIEKDKQAHKHEYERGVELQRRCDADFDVYRKIRKEIDDGDRAVDDIPPMFGNKYAFIHQLMLDGILDTPEAMQCYVQFLTNQSERTSIGVMDSSLQGMFAD